MASLGVRSIDELVGRTELLAEKVGETAKQKRLDLSQIISNIGSSPGAPMVCTEPFNPPHDKAVTAKAMLAASKDAIATGNGGTFSFDVRNTDRSIGF